MSVDIFKKQTFTSRPPERQILTVPVHEKINKTGVQSVLAKAADQIARSGLLWKWVSYDGTIKLCHWDAAEKVFRRGSIEDWINFFGRHWRVFDTNNQEYFGPKPVVADRLIAAVLAHPERRSQAGPCNSSGKRRPNEVWAATSDRRGARRKGGRKRSSRPTVNAFKLVRRSTGTWGVFDDLYGTTSLNFDHLKDREPALIKD